MTINWETRLVWSIASGMPDPDSMDETPGSQLMRSVMGLGKDRGTAAVYGVGSHEPDESTTQVSFYHEGWDPALVDDILEVAANVGFPINELTYAGIKRLCKNV